MSVLSRWMAEIKYFDLPPCQIVLSVQINCVQCIANESELY